MRTVSVIICTRNRVAQLERAVVAVLDQLPASGELLVVDSASTEAAAIDAARRLASDPRVRLVELEVAGLSAARNAGAAAASGALLVYLDDDAVPSPGWLEALVAAFDDPAVAIAGGPILPAWEGPAPDEERLPSAYRGYLGILDRGGDDHDLAPDDGPWGGNYAIRATVLTAVGGFDESLGVSPDAAIGGEEVAVSEHVAANGLGRAAYIAAAAVQHDTPVERLERGYLLGRAFKSGAEQVARASRRGAVDGERWLSAAAAVVADIVPPGASDVDCLLGRIDRGPLALVEAIGAAFAAGEVAALVIAGGGDSVTFPGPRLVRIAAHHARGVVAPVPYRRPGVVRADAERTVLVFETVPEPTTCGAYLRATEMLAALARLGQEPVLLALGDGADATIDALAAVGCEVIVAGRARNAPALVSETLARGFGVAILSFFHVAEPLLPILRSEAPQTALVIDSVDIVHLRLERQAAVSRAPADVRLAAETRTRELAAYRRADVVLAISEAEQDLLAAALPGIPVGVVPNVHRPSAAPTGPAGRRGALFVGTYWHPPNVDAVHVLGGEILPRLRARGYTEPVAIAGARLDDALAAAARDYGLDVLGFLPSVEAELRRWRLSIAPLRFGAGLKGKVGEALGYGVPVIGTAIAAEGYGAEPPGLVVVEDWDSFADAIITLSADDGRWQSLSDAGRAAIAASLGPARCEAELADLIEHLGGRVERVAA